MAVSDKPRKKRTKSDKVVMMPVPTPSLQEFVEVQSMEVTQDPIPPQPNWYPIDWNKVATLADVKFILSNMGLGCSEDAPNYPVLKRYLADIPQAI